jgi:hypothetical protein
MNRKKVNVFDVGKEDFTQQALEIFDFQIRNNPVYSRYVETLHIDPHSVRALTEIPFLPIGLFKSHRIQTTDFQPEAIFESSGTTAGATAANAGTAVPSAVSRHYIKDLSLYRKSFLKGFERTYGPITDWCIIGLLPSYLERSHSSLVVMVDELIRLSGRPDSGFYLYDHARLYETLQRLEAAGQKTLLIGVSFAWLDFAENYSLGLKHTIVMETGGMKGRRREMIRPELHAILSQRFGTAAIHAEYGMTELLSQAYSTGHGRFRPVPWMKVLIRKEDDPFDINDEGEGILNIIDLANSWSCSFLATDDTGKLYADGVFEVSGRVDNSDIRGCSLLVV